MPYDILVTEFMADPSPPRHLPNSEYIELYNRTPNTINLDGFTIQNGSVSAKLTAQNLKSYHYVVIFTKKTGIDFSKFGDTMEVSQLGILSNLHDTFSLVSPENIIIDAVGYDLNFYQNSKKANGGWSLERINTNAPCQIKGWRASEDTLGGTPGKKNSVAVDAVDDEPPIVERYYLKDDKTIVLSFDKTLNRSMANQLSQYQITENVVVSNISIIEPLFQTVQLKLNTALQPKKTYQLFFKNTSYDCQNKPIPLSKRDTLPVRLPDKIAFNDLVVNEILFNPEVGGSRFVELYNRSTKVVDISTLKIGNKRRGDIKSINTHLLLFPDQYLALTDNPPYIQKRYNAYAFRNKIIKNKLPIWDEKAGNVTLYFTDTTMVIDSFNYEKTWHSPLLANTEGVSLEKINPNLPSNEPTSWQSAAKVVSYATPGQQNSQYYQYTSPTVYSDSIQFFSLPKKKFSPDNDGIEDNLEIKYKLNKGGGVATIRIFDDSGKLVKTLETNTLLEEEGTLKWQGDTNDELAARLGIYIILIEYVNAEGTTKREKLACIVAGRL